MITKQEMFNRAWNGLRAQGFKKSMSAKIDSYAMKPVCAYNGDDGYRCAWGHVDPEGTSTPAAEGVNVDGLCTRDIGIAGTLTSSDLHFALRLQEAHDEADDTHPMEDNLRQVAEDYDLTVPA